MSSKIANKNKTGNEKYQKSPVRAGDAAAKAPEKPVVDYNRLPGFRSGKLWEKILACLVYAALLYLLVSYVLEGDYKGVLLVFVVFGCILLDCNYRNVWHYILEMEKWTVGARVIVLFFINVFILYLSSALL